MRKTILLIGAMLLLITLWAEAQNLYTLRITVEHEENVSSSYTDILTFNLLLGDGTTIVILGDADVPFIKELKRLDKQKVMLTIAPDQLERLVR